MNLNVENVGVGRGIVLSNPALDFRLVCFPGYKQKRKYQAGGVAQVRERMSNRCKGRVLSWAQ